MKFDKFLGEQLDSDDELRKEYDALQPIYEISDFLLRYRSENDLTQKELAQMLDIKQSNICRLERGKGNPTVSALQKNC